jgi:hypothetical protein
VLLLLLSSSQLLIVLVHNGRHNQVAKVLTERVACVAVMLSTGCDKQQEVDCWLQQQHATALLASTLPTQASAHFDLVQLPLHVLHLFYCVSPVRRGNRTQQYASEPTGLQSTIREVQR